MRICKRFIALFFLALSTTASALETDILFVLFSQEEIRSLIPVFQSLNQKEKDYRILAMGPAGEELADPRIVSHAFFLKEDLMTHQLVNNQWPIDQTISCEHVDAIADHIQPRIVLSGASCAIQQQIAEKYAGTALLVLYVPWLQDPREEKALKIAEKIAQIVKVRWHACGKEETDQHIVGNPLVDKMRESIGLHDRHSLLEGAGLQSNIPLAAVYCEGESRLYCLSEEGNLRPLSIVLPSWTIEEKVAAADLCLSDDPILLAAALGVGKAAYSIEGGRLESWNRETATLFAIEMPENSVEVFISELERLSE